MEEKFKRCDLRITAAGENFTKEYDLEKDTKRITGVALVANLDGKLYYRGETGVFIAGREVFPDDYHSKMLTCGQAVPPNDRYYTIDHQPGNFKVRVNHQDINHPTETFANYTISVYLRYEV